MAPKNLGAAAQAAEDMFAPIIAAADAADDHEDFDPDDLYLSPTLMQPVQINEDDLPTLS